MGRAPPPIHETLDRFSAFLLCQIWISHDCLNRCTPILRLLWGHAVAVLLVRLPIVTTLGCIHVLFLCLSSCRCKILDFRFEFHGTDLKTEQLPTTALLLVINSQSAAMKGC
mmetsp:Transcript_10762/g.15361  ORF Transcript_10762/g.15361 Transcript_10762/m.15361 type:complete len:112 (-) Transcript_10762:99-434(-)